MELLRNITAYENNKKKRDAKIYTLVKKEKIGNVERNIFLKDEKHYVKHNGKYMQLKNFKEMMKKKNLYQSPTPQGKKCKKDCVAVKKVCNKVTGRCNKPKTKK
jgi:hypothetical protein